MSRLSDHIKDKIVTPELNKKPKKVIGKIISYNNKLKTATIEYPSQSQKTYIKANNVYIVSSELGLELHSPSPDDIVVIEFINEIPFITGFLNDYKLHSTNKLKQHNDLYTNLPDIF